MFQILQDMRRVYNRIRDTNGLRTQKEGQDWLRERGLTPHHLDETAIRLIPTKLHGNVTHVGSASDMRNRR